MGRFVSFFGLSDANNRTVKIAKSYVALVVLDHLSLMMSVTFMLVHIADMLGGGEGMYLEGWALLGVLSVFSMAAQTILDYPTGSIGDWIGQRYLLASAFSIYGIFFVLLALATPESPFVYFLIVMVLMGIGGALESGALSAWLDNNYRVAAPEDTERKQYGVFLGKASSIFLLLTSIVMVPGGLLSALYGRSWVFQFQAVLSFGLAIAAMYLIQDFPELKEGKEERPSLREYGSLLKGGLTYTFGNPFARYTITGLMLVSGTFITYQLMIMIPLYYQYLVFDFAVAALTSLILVPSIFYTERSGVWAKKYEPIEWIPRFKTIRYPVLFMLIAILMFFLPPQLTSSSLILLTVPFTDIVLFAVPVESLLPVIIIFILITITGVFGSIENILTQRVLIDAIPTRVRNGVYSLFPTLMLIFAMPQILLYGWIIQEFGVPYSLLICSLIALIGVFLIRKGLSYPIPKEEPVESEVVDNITDSDTEIEDESHRNEE